MTKNNSNFLWALYNQSKIEYFWDVKCLGPCEAVTICKAGYWLVDWQVLSTWNTSPQTSVLIRNFTNTGANLVISSTPLTSHLSTQPCVQCPQRAGPRWRGSSLTTSRATPSTSPVSVPAPSLQQTYPGSSMGTRSDTTVCLTSIQGRIIDQWHCHVS